VYRDGGNINKAAVMKYNGTSWVTVGSAGFSAGGVHYTSIALDKSGTPYVVYYDGVNNGIATVMEYNGTSWVTVGSAGFSAGGAHYTSIALDNNGTLYVVYLDSSNGSKATVKKYDGTSWETVGSAGFSAGSAFNTSIALDSNGTPYVVYEDGGNSNKATVMRYNGTSWETVGSASSSAGTDVDTRITRIVLNNSGTPYVVYSDVENSDKATVMSYMPQAAAPTATPASGATVEGNSSVTLSTVTSGATIYYTTDGSTPTTSGTSGTSVTISGTPEATVTVKAIAAAPNMSNSAAATFTYTLMQQVAKPTASLAGGEVASGTTVALSTATSGATIYYTTDGSAPSSSNGTAYTGPVSVTVTITIKAIAVMMGMTDSDVRSESYTTLEEAVASAKTALAVGYTGSDTSSSVTQNVTLATTGTDGTTVSWSSGNTAVIAADGTVTRPSYTAGNAAVTLTATIKKGTATETKTFTLTVVKLAQTDEEAVASAKTALVVGYAGSDTASSVTQNVTLSETGTDGTTVSWSSGNTAVIAADGTVTRPSYTAGNTTVALTATISKNGTTGTKTFTLTVVKLVQTNAEAVTAAKEALSVGFGGSEAASSVTQSLTLPTIGADGTTITWSSSDPAVIATDGTVTRPSYSAGDATVTLTATISKDGVTEMKTFKMTVAKSAASSNAGLSGLTLSEGTLNPAFDTTTTGYMVSVANSVSSITVTPTFVDSTATVTVNGTTATSDSASDLISLSVGSNTVNVIVTAQDGTTKTYTVTVMRVTVPNITVQPSGITVNEGAISPSLNVTATVYDSGTLSYLWYSNTTNSISGGSAITGATSASYSAPTSTVGTTYYYVEVTNTNNGVTGTVVSNAVAVIVNALTNAVAPSITTQPTGATVNEGATSPSLSVTATVYDGGTLSYQWYSNTTNSNSGGTAINGETNASFAATTSTLGTTYYYVDVTNTNSDATGNQTATTTSDAVAVVVNALTNAAAPSITTQPQGATVNAGAASPSLSLAASVSDGGTLSYQWYSNTTNSNNGGTMINGAKSESYAAPTSTAGTTYYYVVVMNTNSSVTGNQTATTTSNAVAVVVNAEPVAPMITSHPSNQSVTEGQTALFTVAASGDAPLGYQWKKDGVNINGATSATLTIASAAFGDMGNYTVAVANPAGSVTSRAATLTVNAAVPSSPQAPVGLTASAGNGQVILQWTGVQGAVTYSVYQGTASGSYGSNPAATVSGATYYTAIGLTNGMTYYFTVKASNAGGSSSYSGEVSATPQVRSPGAPQLLSATVENGQVILTWNPVPGSTGYKIYRSVASATDGTEVATVSGSVYGYTVTGLTNGTTYYFTIKSTNPGGISAVSNEMSATPRTVPSAPTGVTATAGNNQATITFTASADNGGSTITGYEVTSSPGNMTARGTASPITITGLHNGTVYTFTMKAINSIGSSAASATSNEVTPKQASSGTNTVAPVQPSDNGIPVLVNGRAENIGKSSTTQTNGQTVTTITFDEQKLNETLAASSGERTFVTITANTKSEVVVGELNGELVKNMEQRNAIIEIKTENATYSLPASQININAISDQFGQSVKLQDIKVQIEIAQPATDIVKIVENSAAKGEFSIVVPPLNFTVKGTYQGKSIEVSKFDAYVERTIAIPDGTDPKKITTAVVVGPDGTVRHVPTKIVLIDGKYYAKVNSLTNSTYSVVWHSVEYTDVANHWAKAAVNDMGSRMVIDGIGNGLFNPDQDITRAEFAAILVRGLGLKLENGASPFSDVPVSQWYSSAINTAHSYSLINGFEDGTFRPNNKITREQAMVMISKAMTITKLKEKLSFVTTDDTLRLFTDAGDASDWAVNSIDDSVKAGIVSGRSGGELAPKAFITRAEVAVIVERLLKESDLI
jgi:hypothetical protein